jgi:hypothetical protein
MINLVNYLLTEVFFEYNKNLEKKDGIEQYEINRSFHPCNLVDRSDFIRPATYLHRPISQPIPLDCVSGPGYAGYRYKRSFPGNENWSPGSRRTIACKPNSSLRYP